MPLATRSNPDVEASELDDLFAALANSTRRDILSTLAQGEASVTELAEPFDMSLPAVSRHLKVLEHAGLVQRTRRAQCRPCTLDPEALAPVSLWAETCRQTWHERFDRLDTYLSNLQQPTSAKPKKEHNE